MRKLTHEEVSTWLAENRPDFIVDEGWVYESSLGKVPGSCRVHNVDCRPSFHGMKQGRSHCMKCGIAKRTNSLRFNEQEVRSWLTENRPDFIVDEDWVYTQVEHKIYGVCGKCGDDCAPNFNNMKNKGTGHCLTCGFAATALAQTFTTKEALLWVLENKPDFIIAPDWEYKNSQTPIPGVCRKCGDACSMNLNNLRQSVGHCRTCGNAASSAAQIFNDEKVHSICTKFGAEWIGGEYKGNHTPILVHWSCGHETKSTIANIQSGKKCPECAEYGYKTIKTGYFYVVSGRGILKCGITNVPDGRLVIHANQGLNTVHAVVEFPDGADAVALEKLWMEHIKTLPETVRVTKEELEDGYTEAVRYSNTILRWIEQELLPVAQADQELAA